MNKRVAETKQKRLLKNIDYTLNEIIYYMNEIEKKYIKKYNANVSAEMDKLDEELYTLKKIYGKKFDISTIGDLQTINGFTFDANKYKKTDKLVKDLLTHFKKTRENRDEMYKKIKEKLIEELQRFELPEDLYNTNLVSMQTNFLNHLEVEKDSDFQIYSEGDSIVMVINNRKEERGCRSLLTASFLLCDLNSLASGRMLDGCAQLLCAVNL